MLSGRLPVSPSARALPNSWVQLRDHNKEQELPSNSPSAAQRGAHSAWGRAHPLDCSRRETSAKLCSHWPHPSIPSSRDNAPSAAAWATSIFLLLFCFCLLFLFTGLVPEQESKVPKAGKPDAQRWVRGADRPGAGGLGAPGCPRHSPGPVSLRRCDPGNRQPFRRLQSSPLCEYGSPEDAFPTGS